MTDLVERLRYAARGELFGDTTLEEAADRITELEAKLANFESDAYVLSLLTKIDELERDLKAERFLVKTMRMEVSDE